MATLAGIRDGIQTRLETIAGLRAYDVVQGQLNVPCAWVRPEDADYGQTQDGAVDWIINVDVYVSLTSMRVAQDTMDAYWDPSSPTSIDAAVAEDSTLGGTVGFAVVTRAEGYGIADVGGSEYLYSRFIVEVGS